MALRLVLQPGPKVSQSSCAISDYLTLQWRNPGEASASVPGHVSEELHMPQGGPNSAWM